MVFWANSPLLRDPSPGEEASANLSDKILKFRKELTFPLSPDYTRTILYRRMLHQVMKSYKLHLIRHGMTDGNLQGRYIGVTDVPVCPEGLQQLDELSQSMDYPYVERVYTSPLTRCLTTAARLFPGTDLVMMPKLRECDFGAFEGKTPQELQDDGTYQAWIQDSLHNAPPDGESGLDFLQRLVQALSDIFEDMMANGFYEAAAVTHGGVIMSLLSSMGLPRYPYNQWMCDYGRGYTILLTPQMWMRDRAFEIYDIVPLPLEEEEEPPLEEL